MTTFLASVSETVVAKPLIVVRRTSIERPSSEPFTTINSAPISLQSAFATVVLPIPAVPASKSVGSSPCATYCLNVVLSDSGRIHSSIFCGRYFSTHKNWSSRDSIIAISNHNIIRVSSFSHAQDSWLRSLHT